MSRLGTKVQTIQKSHEHEPIPLRQQWVISITIKIRGMEFPRATALLDSGSDLNCIRKDLVPVNLWRKSGEQAKSAGGQRLDVSLQVQKVHVCYQRLCLLFDFFLLDNLDYDLLLGTPFLSTISPFTYTKEGVHGNFNGKPVLLRFQPAGMEGVDRVHSLTRLLPARSFNLLHSQGLAPDWRERGKALGIAASVSSNGWIRW